MAARHMAPYGSTDTIYVGRLAWSTDDKLLYEAFRKFGKISSTIVRVPRTRIYMFAFKSNHIRPHAGQDKDQPLSMA